MNVREKGVDGSLVCKGINTAVRTSRSISISDGVSSLSVLAGFFLQNEGKKSSLIRLRTLHTINGTLPFETNVLGLALPEHKGKR